MSNTEAWLKSTSAKQRAVIKDYEAEWKWLNSSPEAKQRSDAVKAQAFSEFKKRLPRADISKFQARVDFDPNRKATGRVLFPDGDGSWENPLIEDRKYWSQGLRDALGFHQDGGFPAQLSLLTQNKLQPVPGVDFSNNITQSIADVLNKEIKIYVTLTDYFTTTFRQIFTNTKITTSAKYAKKWLGGPNMSFWPQQLNFTLWCATTSCGVSREILFSSGSSLNLTPQIHFFYLFHVYYTTRKILYELGGIQSDGALPDDSVFKQKDNPYDIAAYKRICAEFGVDPSTDFRYKKDANHGLGKVFIYVTRAGPVPTGMSYPSDKAKFGDEGGNASDGNAVYFIRNDDGTDKQFEYFAPNHARGFTDIGLACINHSIQAYG